MESGETAAEVTWPLTDRVRLSALVRPSGDQLMLSTGRTLISTLGLARATANLG